jgi:hypothetical protein
MKRYALGLSMTLCVAIVFFGCDQAKRFTATKIKDIQDRPREYEGKDVTVYGTVTGSASLVFVKPFEIEDGSGKISVITGRVLPNKGEKLLVVGQIKAMELFNERLIVIQEKDASGNPVGK